MGQEWDKNGTGMGQEWEEFDGSGIILGLEWYKNGKGVGQMWTRIGKGMK